MPKKGTRRETPTRSKTTKSRQPKKERPNAASVNPVPISPFGPGSLGARLTGRPNGISVDSLVDEVVDRLIHRAVEVVHSANELNNVQSRLVSHAVHDGAPELAIKWANSDLNGRRSSKDAEDELGSDLFRRALRKFVGLRLGLPMDSEAQAQLKDDLNKLSPLAISLLQNVTEFNESASRRESSTAGPLAEPSVFGMLSGLAGSYRKELSELRKRMLEDALRPTVKGENEAGGKADSADNQKCPRPKLPSCNSARLLIQAVELGLKDGKKVEEINRKFTDDHPEITPEVMKTVKKAERRYRLATKRWKRGQLMSARTIQLQSD